MFRMEDLFGTDFGGVNLDFSGEANEACCALGAGAFVLDESISFRTVDSLGRKEQFFVLAHELAHIVQKRNGRRSGLTAPRADLEDEANTAASCVLDGKPYAIELSDASGSPLCWGCAGHFWTTYLVYLFAGASERDAFKTALYCWLPDQVVEFDAAELFFGYFNPTYGSLRQSHYYAIDPLATALNRDQYFLLQEALSSDWSYLETIHRGIHCLTGRSSGRETALRRSIILETRLGEVMRGIAHHAYGDSFAHRSLANPAVMYDAGVGHGFDLHAPDLIFSESRGQTYRDYVSGLAEIALAITRQPPTTPLEHLIFALEPMLHQRFRTAVCPANAPSIVSELAAMPCGYLEKPMALSGLA
jgi:hypothetical protein